MSEAQIKALRALMGGPMTPADIGVAIGGTARGKAQGLGRIGGAIASRLRKAGLVEDCSWLRGGFPMYRITSAGRAILAANLPSAPVHAGGG